MTTIARRDEQRVAAIDRSLDRCRTVADVAAVVFASVRAEVPYTFACLGINDPLSGVITYAYKSRPLDIGDEEFTQAEYGRTDINQLAEIAARTPPVGVLSVDTKGRLDRCKRLTDFMRPRFGFTDEIRLALHAHGLLLGFLAVYRGEGEPPFTSADGACLASVRGVVGEAIRQALFAPDEGHDHSGFEPAVIIIDGCDPPREMTRAARDRIEDLGGLDNGSLPAGILAVSAKARTAQGTFVSRLRLGTGLWLTLRASALLGGDDASVVVTVDVAHPSELTALTLAARGLTAREQDVVDLVSKGASTKTIASTLHLSEHTVQDHLKSVFAKCGVNSRRELIGQLLQ